MCQTYVALVLQPRCNHLMLIERSRELQSQWAAHRGHLVLKYVVYRIPGRLPITTLSHSKKSLCYGCTIKTSPQNICRVSTAGYGSVQSAKVRESRAPLAVLLRWGTETLKGYRQFPELHTLSVDWSTDSALPCTRGIIINTHSSRGVFLDNGESFDY